MYSATAIANFFIEKGINENKPIDQMKVQKLVYYAHAWYLAIKDKPLLNETIEAWKFGPVIPSLYNFLKYSGNNPIQEMISPNLFDNSYDKIDHSDLELSDYLTKIWALYSPLSSVQLSNMTHESNGPWDSVAKEFNYQIPANKDIDNKIIKEWFSELKRKIESNKTELEPA